MGDRARVEADRERCIGAGMCALTAPDLFDQDDADARVVVRMSQIGAEHIDAAHEAARLCPSGALTVRPEEE